MSWGKKYLENAFTVMSQADSLYQSTSFWESACRNISENIIKNGLSNFRKDKTNLSFFVPTYGSPGNSFSEASIQDALSLFSKEKNIKNFLSLEKYLSGELLALADYRVFKSANSSMDSLNLLEFSESSFGNPTEHFKIEGRDFSRSSLNYLLGLTYLKSIMPDFVPKTVLEIGGGFGTLGEILHQIPNQDIKYIDIDLPPMFLIASEYIRNACRLRNDDFMLADVDDSSEVVDIDGLPAFSFFPSWRIGNLRGKIDLFVNFISFQEMEPDVVENYLKVVANLEAKVILLRNMKEGKQKATKDNVGVISPVINDDYGRFLPGYELVDINVVPFGYATVDGFNSELLIFKKK